MRVFTQSLAAVAVCCMIAAPTALATDSGVAYSVGPIHKCKNPNTVGHRLLNNMKFFTKILDSRCQNWSVWHKYWWTGRYWMHSARCIETRAKVKFQVFSLKPAWTKWGVAARTNCHISYQANP